MLEKMKLASLLFATATCLAYLAPLAKAANEAISHASAAQDATSFAIQVPDELHTTCCIALNASPVCISDISMATSCDEHLGCCR